MVADTNVVALIGVVVQKSDSVGEGLSLVLWLLVSVQGPTMSLTAMSFLSSLCFVPRRMLSPDWPDLFPFRFSIRWLVSSVVNRNICVVPMRRPMRVW